MKHPNFYHLFSPLAHKLGSYCEFLSGLVTKTFETQALKFNRDPVASYAINNEKAVLSHWLCQDLSIALVKNMMAITTIIRYDKIMRM